MANIDIDLVNKRLQLLNEQCNIAIDEITRTGRLRVSVGDAFSRGPEALIKLIGQICVLKRYAEAAAPNHNEVLDLTVWQGFFAEFEKHMHVMQSGKLS